MMSKHSKESIGRGIAEELARALTFSGGDAWKNRDVDIEHQGAKITLPAEPTPMSTRQAIDALERKAQDEETELNVFEIINAYPEDALVALNAAMRQKYGWASPTPEMSFFGPRPPTLLTIKTGTGEEDSVQVPFGKFTLPGVENPINVVRHNTSNGMVLVITGYVRKIEAGVVKELARLTRDILRTSSIYKGKAIRLSSGDDGELLRGEAPEYIDVGYINRDELILNADELEQVKSALWTPIEHTEACIRIGIPLNRGVLLEGTYGTGKTMTANVTSKVCVENGWTYILLDDVRSLKEALLFAQRYQPAVIFAEDIDRIADKRDQRGNDLLNTIDGILSKNAQVITVLTTNHVERLDRAMLRPGRLDAVISIKPPNAEAVQRLVRLYGRTTISPSADLAEVGNVLQGNIPATVREVVERSKLTAIANGRTAVAADDLLIAARGMEHHLMLLRDNPPAMSPEHQFGAMFAQLIRSSTGDTGELTSAMAELGQRIEQSDNVTIQAARLNQEAAAQGMKGAVGAMKRIDDKVGEIHRAVIR